MTGGRVLQVVTRWNIGGVAPHVASLSRGLQALGWEVQIVVGRAEPWEGEWPRTPELAFRSLPALVRPLRPAADGRALCALTRLLRVWRPQVVHTHMAKAGLLGALAARAVRVPVVCHTVHGTLWQGHFGPWASALLAATERALAALRDHLFAVGAETAGALRAIGVTAPVTVLPPEPAAPPRSGPPEPLPPLGPGPVLLFAGRLVPVKGVDVLLQAVARLRAWGLRAQLLVVGDGPAAPRLRALVDRLALADRVHFLGWRRDLARLYAQAGVVVLPSRAEGRPRVLLEALAVGRPVVASAVGEVPALLSGKSRGRLVAPGDPDALAEALAEVMRDGRARAETAPPPPAGTEGGAEAARCVAETYVALLQGKPP